jgi:tetratricopeptide (TPR) repeat protein
MQDEIVTRLASALYAELVAAEAHRAERAPNPDSTDLYFQGSAWLNKGTTSGNLAQARGFFDRALAADPGNVRALVGSAATDFHAGRLAFATDPIAAFAAAEAKLIKALSLAPEHALALDRNLASANAVIAAGMVYTGRAEETEGLVVEALRLSPRDTLAYQWMSHAGNAKLLLGSFDQAAAWFRRSVEANRSDPLSFFGLAVALAQLGRADEARPAVAAGLALSPTLTVSRARAIYTAASDDPTYLAQLESVLQGMRKAGVPEQ